MKKYLIIAICIWTLNCYCQDGQIFVTLAGESGGYISKNKLFGNSVELKPEKGEIVSFKVSLTLGGFVEDAEASSNRLSPNQKNLINRLSTGSKFYIEDIKVKTPEGNIIKTGALMFKLDGLNAGLVGGMHEKGDLKALLANPAIYVYDSYRSNDTSTIYRIKSFTLVGWQSDCYYEFQSNNNLLTKSMLDYLKIANGKIVINNMIATDKSQKEVILKNFQIEADQLIARKKADLLKAKKIDLISPTSDLRIVSFQLNGIQGNINELTREMKNIIKEAKKGDVLKFSIETMNSVNKPGSINLNVKIVE